MFQQNVHDIKKRYQGSCDDSMLDAEAGKKVENESVFGGVSKGRRFVVKHILKE